jgi:hypothetical protein
MPAKASLIAPCKRPPTDSGLASKNLRTRSSTSPFSDFYTTWKPNLVGAQVLTQTTANPLMIVETVERARTCRTTRPAGMDLKIGTGAKCKERLARVACRAGLAAALGRSLTEMSAVQGPTLQDYMRRVSALMRWCPCQGSTLISSQDMDALLPSYFDHLYLNGAEAGEGAKLLSAIQHFMPAWKGNMPRSWRALAGWQKLAPSKTRAPMPWLALMLLVCGALRRGWNMMSVAMILQFVCYLRPSELIGIVPESLVPPGLLRHGLKSSWALVLRPFEMGKAAKSGEYDESVMIDRPDLPWLDQYLAALSRKSPKTSVWPFTQAEYARNLTDLIKAENLEALKIDTYSLRHGGVSTDSLEKRRTLIEIKRRGRWRADESVRRYEKASIALKQLELLTPQQVKLGQTVDQHLGKIMMGMMQPPPPATRGSELSRR